jgi:hypothetical protein
VITIIKTLYVKLWTQYTLYQYTNKLVCVFCWRLQCTEELSTHSYHDPNKNNPILQSYYFQTWTLRYPPEHPRCFLLFRFPKLSLYSLLCNMHATCHIMYYLPFYNYVNNIWWTVIDMKLTTGSSASLHSYLSQQIFSSQTPNICSSCAVRHQISHPHKITGTMSVL